MGVPSASHEENIKDEVQGVPSAPKGLLLFGYHGKDSKVNHSKELMGRFLSATADYEKFSETVGIFPADTLV